MTLSENSIFQAAISSCLSMNSNHRNQSIDTILKLNHSLTNQSISIVGRRSGLKSGEEDFLNDKFKKHCPPPYCLNQLASTADVYTKQ